MESQDRDKTQTLESAVRHHNAGRLSEADGIYQHILKADPNNADALHLLGVLNHQTGKSDVAVGLISKALAINPAYAEAHSSLGAIYRSLAKLDEAVACYKKALSVNPDYGDAHYNLGNALLELGQLDEAVCYFQKNLSLTPDNAKAHHNLGNAYKELGRVDEAMQCCLRAAASDANYAEAYSNLGILQLLSGDFLNGWENYARRWQTVDFSKSRRAYQQPLWDGRDFHGKTLLLYPEQGLGDFIQFARYVPMVAQKGGNVTLEVPSALYHLYAHLEGADVVVQTGQSPGPFDLHAPLMDIPGLLGTTLQTIPPWQGHLQVPGDLVEKWKTRLGAYRGLRVGMVWAGNPGHKNDIRRSIEPSLLKPLCHLNDVKIFSLQVGRDGEVVENFDSNVIDLSADLTSFSETAAAMMNLDLIISVDSAPAHLAAALRRPIWTLLPFAPDWRWLLERDDSPWYPDMRLFRQNRRDDWQAVIERVGLELVTLAENAQH